MTLKTLTGPSTKDALADARRLFGDVVLLQSSPGGPGTPASVTVAYDEAAHLAPARPPVAAPPALPAVPAPAEPAAPRPYGYGPARQVRPADAEPFSPVPPAAPAPSAAPPAATADEVAALRARLAELEAALREVQAAAPPPAPRRPPVVLVGRAGSGKTTLALRLAQSPELSEARSPAVLVVAPESGPFLDPAPSFWDAGVPVAVVRSAADVAEAMRTFAGADLLVVDTPALAVHADRARAAIARLGEVLAPLAAVEVVLAVDASRAPESLTGAALDALGLRPDALALTRLDEAPCGPGVWERELGLRARFASSGPDLANLSGPLGPHQPAAPPAGPPAPVPAPVATPVPRTSATPPAPAYQVQAPAAAPATRPASAPVDHVPAWSAPWPAAEPTFQAAAPARTGTFASAGLAVPASAPGFASLADLVPPAARPAPSPVLA